MTLLNSVLSATAFSLVLGLSAMAQSPSDRNPAVLDVPLFAIVETIEFNDVPVADRKAVLDAIGVRTGDMLTSQARQRVAQALSRFSPGKGMTFSYKTGSKFGAAKLIINLGC